MNVYLINTETMEWPIYEGDLYLLFPNTSFPSPLETPPTPYSWVNGTEQPVYDQMTQGVKEIEPIQEFDDWYQAWEVYGLTPEQIAANEEASRQSNKAQAEQLLQQTDWTATVDIADPQYSNPYLGNQPEFLAYRSQVRQIAINPPIVVDVWPTKPEEVWVAV